MPMPVSIPMTMLMPRFPDGPELNTILWIVGILFLI